MYLESLKGILAPFLGTSLGSAFVFFMKKNMGDTLQRMLNGFAAGVMAAASVWSLLLPAIEESQGMGRLSFIPVAAGLWSGILFLIFIDKIIINLKRRAGDTAKYGDSNKSTGMLILAVTIHNIPEGMAVGAVYAGLISGKAGITVIGAFTLALGISIQNIPEGAIISMPLRAEGMSRGKAFGAGVLSGAVEPVSALLTIVAAKAVVPALPYFLSFAAGAMLYVVVAELIPEMTDGKKSGTGALFFASGFSVMMILDVALG